MNEQRAHGRRLMHEQAYLANETVTRIPVILLDISLSGISFATPIEISSGELRQVHFRMPGSLLLHSALIHIVYYSNSGVPAGGRVGARFKEITRDTMDAITDFLSKPPEA